MLTGIFRSFKGVRTAYNVYCANFGVFGGLISYILGKSRNYRICKHSLVVCFLSADVAIWVSCESWAKHCCASGICSSFVISFILKWSSVPSLYWILVIGQSDISGNMSVISYISPCLFECCPLMKCSPNSFSFTTSIRSFAIVLESI